MDILCIQDLHKRFGDKEVLRGLDLLVPENSVFTLAIPASKSEVLPRVSEITFPIPRATKAFLNVDPRDFASEDPEDFPALSASPFITFSSCPEIPSADGMI